MAYLPRGTMIQKLIEDGVIPKECFRFTLVADVGRPAVMRSEVFVSEAQFRAITEAFVSDPDKAREDCKVMLFNRSNRLDAPIEI